MSRSLSLLALVLVACDLDSPPPARYGAQEQVISDDSTSATQPAPTAAPTSDVYASDEVTIGADNPSTAYVDTDPAALSDFHESLNPNGTWVEDSTYGTVWVPSPTVVGPDFVPYVSSGHWTYDDDYVWVSDYDWGWAPFHYGRWVYVAGRGWCWIAGRTYRGSWVVWRTGEPGYGYVGWAPAPPVWVWRGGVAVGIGFVPAVPYTFVASGDVFHPSVASRVMRGPQVAAVAEKTRPWSPASPGVGGVGGPARTPGQPSVGPPPQHFGADPGRVPRPAMTDPGLGRARQAARPVSGSTPGSTPTPTPYSHVSPQQPPHSSFTAPPPQQHVGTPAPEQHPMPAPQQHIAPPKSNPPPRAAPRAIRH